MNKTKSLGDFIREKRQEKDLSLRELAKRVGKSAAFLSDIELGNRYPSEEALEDIRKVLKISKKHIEKHDSRPPTEEVKAATKRNPDYAIAFRKAIKEDVDPKKIIRFIDKSKKS